jgi:hypothetical protein
MSPAGNLRTAMSDPVRARARALLPCLLGLADALIGGVR